MIIPQVAVVFNWRSEENKSGVYSIHLRVTLDRVARYYRIEVPRKVAPAQWSGAEDAWVKTGHLFAIEINQKIREKKAVVLDLVKRSYNYNKNEVTDVRPNPAVLDALGVSFKRIDRRD